jgi:hypothetical protein
MNEAPSGNVEGSTRSTDTVTVRLVMPDRWLEHVAELPSDTPVAAAKRLGLRAMLLRDGDDPADYYVEYAEREVADESQSLKQIGFRSRDILSIRAYDLGHYRPFLG